MIRLRTVLFAATVIAALASCKPDQKTTKLNAPEPVVASKTATAFSISWSAVEGAETYTYECEELTGSVTETAVTIEDRETNATYIFRVKAVSSKAEDSDWAEISVTLSEEGGNQQDEPLPDVDFNMTATADDSLRIVVTTAPEDKEMVYYFEPLTASVYEGEFGSDPKVAFTSMMSTYVAYFGDAAAAYSSLGVTGDKNRVYSVAQYGESKFYVLAAGIDEELNLTTNVQVVDVEIELPTSSNTFEIVADEVTYSSLWISVYASNADPFTFILTDTETVSSMSQARLKQFVYNYVNEDNIFTYEGSLIFDKNIRPSHSYTVLAFGFDQGVVTTDVTSQVITTPDPEVDNSMTFTFEASLSGTLSIAFKITPSNLDATYFYELMPESTYEQYKDNLLQYCLDVIEKSGLSVYRYFEYFSSVGVEEDEYSRLEPNTRYILWAAGMELDGDSVKFYTPSIYDGELITGSEGGGNEGGNEGGGDVVIEEWQFEYLDLSESWESGKIMASIEAPASKPYVYAVLTEEEYNQYSPKTGDAFKAYFEALKTTEGNTGTFAEYIATKTRYAYVEDHLAAQSGTTYILVAAGITTNGDDVIFHTPAESNKVTMR